MLGNCCDRPEIDRYHCPMVARIVQASERPLIVSAADSKPTHSHYQVDPFQTLALVMDQLDRRSNLSY